MRSVTLGRLGEAGMFRDGDWVESIDQDSTGPVRLTQLADVGVGTFRDRSDRWMREDQAARLSCTFLRPADILIARMPDPLGRACLVPQGIGRAVTAVDVAILRVDPAAALPTYVMWMINSPQFNAAVVARQSGTTRKRISRKNLAMLSVPLPEIREQRRLVEILEDHLSRLDAAAGYVSNAQQRAATMVSSLRQRTVAAAARCATVHTLGELASVGTGTTPKRSVSRYYESGDIPWITSGDLSQGDIFAATRFVTDAALAETSLKRYPPRTLLIAMYGEGKTRGTVAELAIPATVNQACAALQVHDEALQPWIRFVLEANYSNMRRLAAGGVQPNLNLRLIKAIEVPVPTRADREHLLASTIAAFEGAASIRAELEPFPGRAAALRRAVLAAAFSGKLTGRRTDEEVIEEVAEAQA